jgi:16S rRNA (guanine527-N7)-methyltransferase
VAPRDFSTRLTRRASRVGLFLNDELVEKLATFCGLLFRWNQKINLTSIADPDEAVDRLLLEPLLAARYVPASVTRLMDIGSGGGSPAIPLKLALPHVPLTMVEAKVRKSAFLRDASRQLGLAGTDVETTRVEELLARPQLHEAFDLVSMRAVRIEMRMLNTIQAFLSPGGHVLLFRGPHGPAEPAVVPPLQWVDTYPLLEVMQSRVTLLQKRPIGAYVPRGTVPSEA